MKKVTCSRCKKRPAVIFISKIIDGKTVPEGLCLNCAMEMNIGPIKQMMDSMGETDALAEERLQGNRADQSALDQVLSKGQMEAMKAAQKEQSSPEGRVRSYVQRRNGRKVLIQGYERASSSTKEIKPE